MLIIEIEKRHNKMVDRIRWDTVSYLPFYYVFFQFLLLTIFNLQANILTTKDILSNLACGWSLYQRTPAIRWSSASLDWSHSRQSCTLIVSTASYFCKNFTIDEVLMHISKINFQIHFDDFRKLEKNLN